MLVQRSGSHCLSLGNARPLAPDRFHRRREAVPSLAGMINSDSWSSGPACAGRAAKAEPGADAGPAAARSDTALIPNAPASAGSWPRPRPPSAGSGHYAWLQRAARFSPFAWDVSWDDAPHSPSAARAVSAMTCAIRAARTFSARRRTSCKRQVSGSIPLTGSQVRRGKSPPYVSVRGTNVVGDVAGSDPIAPTCPVYFPAGRPLG